MVTQYGMSELGPDPVRARRASSLPRPRFRRRAQLLRRGREQDRRARSARSSNRATPTASEFSTRIGTKSNAWSRPCSNTKPSKPKKSGRSSRDARTIATQRRRGDARAGCAGRASRSPTSPSAPKSRRASRRRSRRNPHDAAQRRSPRCSRPRRCFLLRRRRAAMRATDGLLAARRIVRARSRSDGRVRRDRPLVPRARSRLRRRDAGHLELSRDGRGGRAARERQIALRARAHRRRRTQSSRSIPTSSASPPSFRPRPRGASSPR